MEVDQEVTEESHTYSLLTAEMKKPSFYVLFLGAKESRGLRGSQYVEPVLQYFISQESRMQALKVTLQIGNKGLKLIPVHQKTTMGDFVGQTDKYFIPHHAITCVFQSPPPNEDVVSCILLIYNPDTKCPVHVHCYRCDSSETANHLRLQIESLVNREENQKKLKDIETKLQSKGLLPSRGETPDFDCKNSDMMTISSVSDHNSDRGFGGSTTNVPISIATLYDSLAAELREKLNTRNSKNNPPILFPPRDYDTVHRQRGNLSGIEARRCSNPAVVGRRSYASREQDSCGRSSGIGSAEDNCSPIHDHNAMDSTTLNGFPSSSDDEDWNSNSLVVNESSQFLVRPMWATSCVPITTITDDTPPPLPKRPEMRQRLSPESGVLGHPPPLPPPHGGHFSKEKFEGVRQKWEKLDHQYNNNKRSHDSVDDGYRSREAVEADYRRQLSRESLLRSLSRSNKTGSRDSLDRWVEAGVRTKGIWRNKLDSEEAALLPPTSYHPSTNPNGNSSSMPPSSSGGGCYRVPSPNQRLMTRTKLQHAPQSAIIPESRPGAGFMKKPSDIYAKGRNQQKYRELDEQERYPGLDKDTARLVHSSSLQHIYSEPNFDNSKTQQKSKKFSFAFWK